MSRGTNTGDTGGARPKRSAAVDRKAYIHKLILLMGIITVLLVVVLLLLPDRGADPAAGATEERTGRAADDRSPDVPEEVASGDDAGDTAQPATPDEREPTPVPQPSPEPTPGEREPHKDRQPPAAIGSLAIVIDDVGNDLDSLRRFLDLPGPITFAVLPQRRHSEEAAGLIAEAGHETIMHLPMEPIGEQNPGEGAIYVSLPAAEIEATIEANLQTVPGAVGVNNHMGSRATADPSVMDAVLKSIHRRGLFFLDSRTSAETVGAVTAIKLGVPHAERTVFLDNDPDPDEIEARLREGMDAAVSGGEAVLIGHVTVPALADVLVKVWPELAESGLTVRRLSELVRKDGVEYARAGD